MLRPRNSEIPNVLTVYTGIKPQTEYCGMEPNPSKDRVMHEGNDPSF
jgi:hypothetical protein